MTRTAVAVGAPFEYRSTAGDSFYDPLAPAIQKIVNRLVHDPFWIPTPAELAMLSRPPLPYYLMPIGTRHG